MNITLPKSRGFTLMELLLVISIISLLSSIVIVSTSRARAKAVDAKTASDTVQARTAINVYNSTHAGYPVCGSGQTSCCVGSNSCFVAGAQLTTKLPITEMPEFGENLPTYYDSSGLENQGYIYSCSSSLTTGQGEVYCPEANVSIIYSNSQGIYSMDINGSRTFIGSSSGNPGDNPPPPDEPVSCFQDSDCQSGQWCNNFDLSNPNRLETAGTCAIVTLGSLCNIQIHSTSCGNTSMICTQNSETFTYSCTE